MLENKILFPRFCTPPSEVVVLFNMDLSMDRVLIWNLLFQVLCTEFILDNADFYKLLLSYSETMAIETNEWFKNWAKQLLWLWILGLYHVLAGSIIHWNFIFTRKTTVFTAKNLQIIRTLLNWVRITWQACCCQQWLLTLKCPVFELAPLACQSCTWVLPQLEELSHWFCSQNSLIWNNKFKRQKGF